MCIYTESFHALIFSHLVNSTEILLSINHTDSDATTSNHTTAELSQSQDYEELHASQQYATIETDITSVKQLDFIYILTKFLR